MTERPSAIEFIKNANLEQRNKENQTRTEEITRKLVDNSSVFGGDTEEEKSEQICQEILGVFGAGYKSVESMSNTLRNPSSTDRQKDITKENLAVLGKSVFVAMNKTFANYSKEATETITSQLAPEEIDGLLPKQLQGIGRYVKEMDDKATEDEKKEAKEPFKNKSQNVDNKDYDVNLAATRSFEQAANAGEEGKEGEGKDKGMPLFMLTKEDIVTTEMMQRNKEQFHFSPPYPPWFKELAPDDKRLWMVRIKLVNGAAYKQALRNMDVEKLMFNRALDISRDEFKLLFKMEKFQEAVRGMFGDLLEWDNPKAETGFRYLRLKKMTEGELKKKLKKEEEEKGKKKHPVEGFPLNEEVEKYLTHFESYKETLALRLDGDSEAEKSYNEGKRASFKSRSAVGAAWNFLYIGNIIESADVDRQLKPTEVVSDKIRTMIHPLQKALGKWGIYKEGKGSLQGITGEEEPMGGDIASWIKYHLELGDIRGDQSFRDKVKSGIIKPFPKRTSCSIMELLTIETKDKIKTNLAELIMASEDKIELDNSYDNNDLDIYSDYRDIMDGCKTAYDYLSGSAKFEVQKGKEWVRKFNADIALIRQYNANGVEEVRDGNKVIIGERRFRPALSFVDDPEFIAWVIAASTGFDHRSNRIILNFKSIGANNDNYDLVVNKILTLPGLVDFNMENYRIKEILGSDKGHVGTKRMLYKNKHEVFKNENEMRGSIKKGTRGTKYGDY